MKLLRQVELVTPTLSEFPADTSFALIVLNGSAVSLAELSAAREAARLCDKVIAVADSGVRQPKLLEEAGVDVLLQLPLSQRVSVAIDQADFNTVLQAILLVLPNVVVLNNEQQELKQQLNGLETFAPGVVAVRVVV